jgi:multiple sugar transport system permease protein
MHERWIVSLPLRQQNYAAAWEIIDIYITNTLFVAGVGLAGVLIMSLVGGHVFARLRFPFKEQLYFGILILLAVPWVLSFIPSYMLFSDLGMMNTPWVLIIPNLANGPVFGIFLMRAVIEGIPEELYEAARCDGASLGREIFSITLPLALPGLATLAIVNFVGTWNWFFWPLVTITDRANQLISVGLFLLTSGDFSGVASFGPLFAGYVIASIPLVILFIFLGRFYVEGLTQSGVKV